MPPTATLSHVEKTDREIVRLLAADGRMSYTDLGKATGLSTSAVISASSASNSRA